ncbi:restriction endonuclease subunit S [Muribaculum sp.]|uniref:restriction endonuclease subunit S n=1 Tax=Muribaculum sp. TaxID=1918611 RepID=UPI00258C1BFC|nr:restriction endonuclease subunit S [Muribaculum sp.]MCX4279020.1 restriction endonuclease subunit S [Muribaculum sp.]
MSETKVTRWVRLGDYIEQCDERAGNDFTVDDVIGISTDKKFIPTKANMDGVSLNSYKIVNPHEFAYVADTSRRGDKIALALNTSNKPVLISSIYTSFRSKDVIKLLPEYLFMLLNRAEFDRYARFNSWGSARETFDWGEMCRIEIPLPDIEVQRELVATYNGLKTLAEQNEALLPRLSAACHAYIVDCRAKYPAVPLGEYIEQCDERAGDNFTVDDVIGISTDKNFIATKANMDGVSLKSYKVVQPHEFAYVADTSRRGDKIALALNTTEKPVLISSIYTAFRSKDTDRLLPGYLLLLLNRTEFDRYTRFNSWGSARETFDWSEMCRVEIPVPPIEIQKAIVEVFKCSERAKKIGTEARERMKNLCPALVQRAANS